MSTSPPAKAERAGLALAWHNHDFEYAPTTNGSRPIDLILEHAPSIGWEADIAWMVRGGADPCAELQRYTGRVPACHVKDLAAPGTARDEGG